MSVLNAATQNFGQLFLLSAAMVVLPTSKRKQFCTLHRDVQGGGRGKRLVLSSSIVEWGKSMYEGTSGSIMDPNKYAFICTLGMVRSFDTVATSRIFVLLDNNRRRSYVPKTDDLPNSKLSLAVVDLEGKTLTRCHILFTAASRDDVQTELNLGKAQGTRLTCPPRRSIGVVKFPVDDYLLQEERETAKSKLKKKNVAKQAEKEKKSDAIKVKGLKSLPSHTSTPIKRAVPSRSTSTAPVLEKEHTVANISKKDDQGGTVVKDALVNMPQNKSEGNATENWKDVQDAQDVHLTPHIESEGNGNGNVKSSGGDDLETPQSSKAMKDPAPPKISVSRASNELTRQMQELNQKFEEKAETDQKCFNEILSLLKDLSLKVSAPPNDELKQKSKKCAISELESLVANRPTSPVPPEMVYIGSGNYITKHNMVAVEKEKSYRGRLNQVVALVLKHPEKYNLTGGEGMEKLTDEHLEAIHGFLNALKWKKINLNPIKVGNRVLQPLTEDFVRRTVSKCLSEMAASKKPDDNEGASKKKKNEDIDKKRNHNKDDGANKKKKGKKHYDDDSSEDAKDNDEEKDEDEDEDEDDYDRFNSKKMKLDEVHSDVMQDSLEDVSLMSIPGVKS